jgi:hypothetical protein
MKLSSVTYIIIFIVSLIILLSIVICIGLYLYYYFTNKQFESDLIVVLLTLFSSFFAFSLLTFNQLKSLFKSYKI